MGGLGGVLKASKGCLGGSRRCLGVVSSTVLGESWAVLGASWGRLGASWGRLGGVLGASWGVLEASWSVLASLSAKCRKHGEGRPPEFEDVSRVSSILRRWNRYQDSGGNRGGGLPALRGGPPRPLGPPGCWRFGDTPTPGEGPKRSRHASFFASWRHLGSSCRSSCPTYVIGRLS